MAVVSVGGSCAVQNGSGEDGLRENAGGIVEQFGEREGGGEGQAVRQPFFELGGESVVSGVTHVVAEQRHRGEPGIGAKQLLRGHCGPAKGRRGGNLTVIGVGHFRQQRCSHSQILRRKLVDVGIRYPEARVFRAEIARFHAEIVTMLVCTVKFHCCE